MEGKLSLGEKLAVIFSLIKAFFVAPIQIIRKLCLQSKSPPVTKFLLKIVAQEIIDGDITVSIISRSGSDLLAIIADTN